MSLIHKHVAVLQAWACLALVPSFSYRYFVSFSVYLISGFYLSHNRLFLDFFVCFT